MTIDWNHVTKFSQVAAIVLFVAVFALGFWLGKEYEYHAFQNAFAAGGVSSAPQAAPTAAGSSTPHGLPYGAPRPQ